MRHLALFATLALATPAFAHDPGISTATLEVSRARLTATVDFSRAELRPLLDAESLEAIARRALELTANGRRLDPITVTARASGDDDYRFALAFEAGRDLARFTARVTLFDDLARGHRQLVTVRDAGGGIAIERILSAATPSVEVDAGTRTASGRGLFAEFLVLGVEHILIGYDHLLFLFALLIVGCSLGAAARIITSFTVAHSITLALASLGVVSLPGSLVEPLIAASIVWVGVENLLRPGTIERRWKLTFAFGLIHGFGFAGVLQDLGLGSTSVVVPLLAFNLGVEVGQLAVAAVVLPVIWLCYRRTAAMVRLAPACSVLAGACGAWWLVERTLL